MDRRDKDINEALDFLRNSMNDEHEETKVRQISAKTILSFYRDIAASAGKKRQAEDRALKLVKGKFAPAKRPAAR
ncbi:MAG TPA: hypothetical protein VK110_05515 [Salinisphaeraceae bacterium]|nr:hypothetical protein [Salinisphaeraceae bacterium]